MKYAWETIAALSGLVVVWAVWRKHLANQGTVPAPFTVAQLKNMGVVPYVAPTLGNVAGSFAAGLSQTPYDPNAVEGT